MFGPLIPVPLPQPTPAGLPWWVYAAQILIYTTASVVMISLFIRDRIRDNERKRLTGPPPSVTAYEAPVVDWREDWPTEEVVSSSKQRLLDAASRL